jgi:uncharacterized protein with PIN domain
VTTFEWDDAGNLIREVSTPEPEWDDLDRAEMEALAFIEADECPGCRGSLEETTDPNAMDTYTATPVRCHRCTALHIRQDQHGSDETIKQHRAVLWSTEKR